MDTIIENINDYVWGECTAMQCGFSDEEVNEIYATFASESGEKVLEDAVKALTDEEYDDAVEKIAKNIYKKRQAEGKAYRMIKDMDFYYSLQNEAIEKGWEFYQSEEGGDVHLVTDANHYVNEEIEKFLKDYPELQHLYLRMF